MFYLKNNILCNIMDKNILLIGSCRLNLKLNNIFRFPAIKYIHNHMDFLNILELKNNFVIEDKYYQYINRCVNFNLEDIKNIINKIDIILIEVCTYNSWFLQINDVLISCKAPTEIFGNESSKLKITNTTQKRGEITAIFPSFDNFILENDILYNIILFNNYNQNNLFFDYNYENNNTIVNINNMPNNNFQTFGFTFDTNNCNIDNYIIIFTLEHTHTNILYIKYFDGNNYIYTDKVLETKNILEINNVNIDKIIIGFYLKNNMNEIMTSGMLKKESLFYWNFKITLKKIEFIVNNTLKNNISNIYLIKKKYDNNTIIENLSILQKYFQNKKIIIIPHLTKKNEPIKERLRLYQFLQNNIKNENNLYFFDNYVTDDMLMDENHYSEYGYNYVTEKISNLINRISQ